MPGGGLRVWLGGWAVACAFAIGVACGTYGEESAVPADAAREPADAPLDDVRGPASDAGDAPTDSPSGVCPAAKYPSTSAVRELPQRLLYAPDPSAGDVFPFAITTDQDAVYWLEQRASGEANNPYDGLGVARVLRVGRGGATGFETAFELASNQRYAMALTLDGDWLYWVTAGPNTLRRVRRDCKTPPCAVESFATIPERISRLFSTREGRGILFGVGESSVFRIEVNGAVVALGAPGAFPAIAVSSTHVYWAGFETPRIGRADLSALSVVPEFIRLDGDAGLGVMTTDCTRLWGSRSFTVLTRIELDGSVTPTGLTTTNAFDLVADERYVYVGTADNQGLHVYDKQNGQSGLLAAGSFWRLATDDVGTYWAEHSRMGGTAGKLTMLVK